MNKKLVIQIGSVFSALLIAIVIRLGVMEPRSVQPSVTEAVPSQSATSSSEESSHHQPDPHPLQQTISIPKGGTLQSVLKNLGVPDDDAQRIIICFGRLAPPRSLKAGQEMMVTFDESRTMIQELVVPIRSESNIVIRKVDADYRGAEQKIPLTRALHYVRGQVQSNFYKAALKAGVSKDALRQAISILGHTTNFQSALQCGDPFEVLYEVYKNPEGRIVKSGSVRYVSIAPRGQLTRIYGFGGSEKAISYFNEKGEGIVRSLLQTPLDIRGIRITSRFSHSRYHPIKKYCRAHRGIDFGARTGTPVKASGNGVIVKREYQGGGYGNFVQIRHSGGYETLYAHLSRFAPHIRVGSVVKQGELIGYVGATGLATGPHLHYEVRLNNVHQNPERLKMMPTVHLRGHQLKQFQVYQKGLMTKINHVTAKNVNQNYSQILN